MHGRSLVRLPRWEQPLDLTSQHPGKIYGNLHNYRLRVNNRQMICCVSSSRRPTSECGTGSVSQAGVSFKTPGFSKGRELECERKGKEKEKDRMVDGEWTRLAMWSDVCFLQFIPSCVCDFQRLSNSWGKIISIKGSHALGIGCGIRFSSLSALLCLAAGWITSNLHLDSDILMMNYAPLSSCCCCSKTAFCPNVSPLRLMQGSERIIKKYCFRLLSIPHWWGFMSSISSTLYLYLGHLDSSPVSKDI